MDLADQTKNLSKKIDGLTYLAYDTTPPKLPVDFEVNELAYRGNFNTI